MRPQVADLFARRDGPVVVAADHEGGASMQPRTGMLDQEMAAICQSTPNGSGRGNRVARFGVIKIWVTSRG
jgi:hypothetical protein